MRRWTQFVSINLTAQGFVADVTGFSAGVYPFRCHGYNGNLVITLGALVFPTQDMSEPDHNISCSLHAFTVMIYGITS